MDDHDDPLDIRRTEKLVDEHLARLRLMLNLPEHHPRLAAQLAQDADALTRLGLVASKFRTAVNATRPVSRLPQELFRMIVLYVVELEPPFPPKGERDASGVIWDDEDAVVYPTLARMKRRPTLGWISLTHVSKAWRENIIGDPSLWARSIGLLPKAIPEFIRRASGMRALDLTIRAALTKERLQSLLRLPTSHIRSISWTFNSKTARSHLKSMIAGSSRKLRTLETLRCAYIPASYSQPETYTVYAPSLRRIELTGLLLDFDAPNLVHLTLDHPPRDSFDVTAMLNILSSCSRLETASVKTVYNVAYKDAMLQGRSVVVLKHLQRLSIAAPFTGHDLIKIMRLIRPASNASIDIRPGGLYTAEDFAIVKSMMSAPWRVGQVQSMRFEERGALTLFWEKLPDAPDSGGSVTISTGLGLRSLSTAHVKECLQDVMELIITDKAAADTFAGGWKSFLNIMPQIKHLKLRSTSDKRSARVVFSRVLEVLSEIPSHPDHPDQPNLGPVGLPLPALSTLTLGPNIGPECLPLDVLVDKLSRRLDSISTPRSRLRLLTITECTYPKDARAEWSETLMGLAEKVVWKGDSSGVSQ
ncbi:unnamed protein product [Peniophora sp. CBMAI 1063]|nr:unnamed protein product [Peniophora sp. CBMAI 1063]